MSAAVVLAALLLAVQGAGSAVLIPNRDVYNNALINLTRRGKRRTVVMVGVDYRDDHDDARAVIFEASVPSMEFSNTRSRKCC